MEFLALCCGLLGEASPLLAEDPDPADNDTQLQEARGTYPLFDRGVSAVLRVEDVYTTVTTRVDEPDAENWHMVMLQSQCDGGVKPSRAIVFFNTAKKVTYKCPNPDPTMHPPEYFIEFAQATLTDVDDALVDPNGQFPSNDLLVTVDDPGPEDVVPPRPTRPTNDDGASGSEPASDIVP